MKSYVEIPHAWFTADAAAALDVACMELGIESRPQIRFYADAADYPGLGTRHAFDHDHACYGMTRPADGVIWILDNMSPDMTASTTLHEAWHVAMAEAGRRDYAGLEEDHAKRFASAVMAGTRKGGLQAWRDFLDGKAQKTATKPKKTRSLKSISETPIGGGKKGRRPAGGELDIGQEAVAAVHGEQAGQAWRFLVELERKAVASPQFRRVRASMQAAAGQAAQAHRVKVGFQQGKECGAKCLDQPGGSCSCSGSGKACKDTGAIRDVINKANTEMRASRGYVRF
ncbi:MAG: hypothetical protein C4521_05190 [Actinobacteria bacterium]|nr:MAG: hypothetical protein C4521_05190 [Actinomycetota bacterium]